MTVRVTLRLPEPVYERLRLAARQPGRSLNQVIVDALRDADLGGRPPAGASAQDILAWALRDLARPWTDADDALMAGVFGEDDGMPALSHEELQAAVPPLSPPVQRDGYRVA